jgi:hypothetical protein
MYRRSVGVRAHLLYLGNKDNVLAGYAMSTWCVFPPRLLSIFCRLAPTLEWVHGVGGTVYGGKDIVSAKMGGDMEVMWGVGAII